MFGRKEVQEVQETEFPDSAYARAWGYTREGWNALTWQDRADYRDRVVYAPFFNQEGK